MAQLVGYKGDGGTEETESDAVAIKRNRRRWFIESFYNGSGSTISQGDWVELDETGTTFLGREIQQGTLDDDRVVGVALEEMLTLTWGKVLRFGVIDQAEDGFYVKMTDTTVVGPVSPAASGGSVAATGSGPVIGYNLATADSNGASLIEVRCMGPDLATGQNVFDANGVADAFILDTDGDTTISAPTDDQIDIEIAGADDFTFTANAFNVLTGSIIDFNGVADSLVLDADGDTTISAPTDDQIDIEIAGADDFTFTANSFNVLDGSVLSIQGGGTGTGDIVQRIGGSATEGLETRVYEETVSPVAVETNVLNTPDGSVILSVQTNVETTLVAGGTSVTLSIGTAADPDKYGTHGSDSLAQNQKIDTIPDWAVLSGAEQMVLTAAATGGASDGDTAFSSGSVRVRVVYLALNSLDNA